MDGLISETGMPTQLRFERRDACVLSGPRRLPANDSLRLDARNVHACPIIYLFATYKTYKTCNNKYTSLIRGHKQICKSTFEPSKTHRTLFSLPSLLSLPPPLKHLSMIIVLGVQNMIQIYNLYQIPSVCCVIYRKSKKYITQTVIMTKFTPIF